MGSIRIKHFYFFAIIMFLLSCGEKKTEIFKMHTDPYRDKDRKGHSEYYIVSNPPEDLASIILFYQSELKRFSTKEYEKKLKNTRYYFLYYFEERFLFDRDYQESPSFSGRMRVLDLFSNNLSVVSSHGDDLFMIIFVKHENAEPITPYLKIVKWKLEYYPKGLKTNPDIHWGTYKDGRLLEF